MDIELLLNWLGNQNIQDLSKQTNIPAERMYKWKQGKGTPKPQDAQLLWELYQKDMGILTEEDAAYASKPEIIKLIKRLKPNFLKIRKGYQDAVDPDKLSAEMLSQDAQLMKYLEQLEQLLNQVHEKDKKKNIDNKNK